MDYVKINVDAAFREETMSGGWGAIGRDSTAEVCVAVAGILTWPTAMHAETAALTNATQVAKQMGIGRVIFETDYLNLKQAMTMSDYSFSLLKNLISDLKFKL
jgi:ribonuclease HI